MHERLFRHVIIAVLILGCMWWSLATAKAQDRQNDKQPSYPNADILATPEWLAEHKEEVIIVDVRTDKYFDGTLIPGAIRMPWSMFRMNDKTRNLAEAFVGISESERILGQHGIARQSSIVIYDSVKRDGGATASYVFWVLDILGHENKRVLEGGIDAWKAAGGEVAKSPQTLPSVTYESPAGEIMRDRLIAGEFIKTRLNDPHYQILDVRSPEEYRGKKGTKGMQGEPLKLGHIPGAYNLEYTRAWVDKKQKKLKPAEELKQLYAGINPNKTVIVYCNSGRRSSFSYFILRLLGHPRVITYEQSWKEWGLRENHYPVELDENPMPTESMERDWKDTPATQQPAGTTSRRKVSASDSDQPAGGYVSCGG